MVPGGEEGEDKEEVVDHALVAHSGQGYHCAVCAQRQDNWVCFEEGVKASEDGEWSSFEHKRITTCIRYWKAMCQDTCASREKLEEKLAPDMCLPIEVMRRRQEQYANTKKARRMTKAVETTQAVEPAPLPPAPSAVGDVQGKSGEVASTTPVTAQVPPPGNTKKRKISSDPQQTRLPGSGAGAGGARAVESHSYCGVNRLEGGEGKGFAAVVDFGDKDCLIACGPWETGVCCVCFEGVDSCACLRAC